MRARYGGPWRRKAIRRWHEPVSIGPAGLGGLAGAGCLRLRFEAPGFARDGGLHLKKDVSDAARVVEALKELGEAFHAIF